MRTFLLSTVSGEDHFGTLSDEISSRHHEKFGLDLHGVSIDKFDRNYLIPQLERIRLDFSDYLEGCTVLPMEQPQIMTPEIDLQRQTQAA